MPLLGPMELGKKSPHDRKQSTKEMDKWHLVATWQFFFMASEYSRCQPCSACNKYPAWPICFSNSRAQQRPAWVVDASGDRALKLDTTQHGLTTRQWPFHFPVPLTHRDASRKMTPKCSLSPWNTVIKYWNPILYFPGVLFLNGFPNLVTPVGYQHIAHVSFDVKLLSDNIWSNFQVHQFFFKF